MDLRKFTADEFSHIHEVLNGICKFLIAIPVGSTVSALDQFCIIRPGTTLCCDYFNGILGGILINCFMLIIIVKMISYCIIGYIYIYTYIEGAVCTFGMDMFK